YCKTNRPERARAIFDRLAANDFSSLPRDFTWLIAHVLIAEVCVELDDTARAGFLYERLYPFRERCVSAGYAGAFGGVGRPMGKLAAFLGRREDAKAHFEYALTVCAKMGMRPALVRTQFEFASILGADSPAERECAVKLLADAKIVANELGMSSLVDEI